MGMDFVKLMESMSLSENPENRPETFSFYKLHCAVINNIPTDIIYADHENKLFIIASQYKKFGSLLSVTKEQIVNLECTTEPLYTVNLLFGSEDIEQQVAARYIAEKLNINKPLNIFLCLNKYEPEVVKALVDVLLDIRGSE